MADVPEKVHGDRSTLVRNSSKSSGRCAAAGALRILLQGGVIVLAGALAAIALASVGLQTYKFSPQSVTGFRIAVFAAFAVLLLRVAGAADAPAGRRICRSRCTSKSTSRRCRPRS